jgi:DNA-binding protein HU-beta
MSLHRLCFPTCHDHRKLAHDRLEELMNRGQLIDALAAATELPRTQVEATITATLAQVRGTVASGEKVQLPGFGTFEPRERGARTAHNPSTGAQLQLAATRAVGFKVGATFKQEVADSLTAKAPKKAAAKKAPAKTTASKATATKKTTKKSTKK